MPHRPTKRDLSPNMEDYLETIYLQGLEGVPAKVKHIADAMGVSKPSVTEALSVLQDRGLVRHQKYGDVELTEQGRSKASEIYHRHRLFKLFFQAILAMPEDEAEDNACKVEHLVSETAVERLEALLAFLEKTTSNGGPYRHMIQHFHRELAEKD